VRAIAVFFEPGSRTEPHTHDEDQLLVCLSGEGVVAIEGAAERIVPHDTVWIPKGTWHWNGASTARAMCHLTAMPKGTESTWDGIESRDWRDYRHDWVVPFAR
jgi:quercetin dioxygenase-like cupin family protein